MGPWADVRDNFKRNLIGFIGDGLGLRDSDSLGESLGFVLCGVRISMETRNQKGWGCTELWSASGHVLKVRQAQPPHSRVTYRLLGASLALFPKV